MPRLPFVTLIHDGALLHRLHRKNHLFNTAHDDMDVPKYGNPSCLQLYFILLMQMLE